MLEARVHDSVTDIAPEDWNRCFGDALEDHAYHLAVERAGLPGFRFFYVTVAEAGRVVGAVPAFLTPYDLETTLDHPGLRKAIVQMKQGAPWFLRASLAALGSPCTEMAMLGIADPPQARPIAALLLDAFLEAARARGGALMAVKDLAETDRPLWQPLLAGRGFGVVSGLPVARLPIDFTTLDDYLARLSHATRKDMRRKLRGRNGVELKRVTTLDGFEDAVMALYRATRARAEMVLEDLTPDYFRAVLEGKPGRAFCALYLKDGELLAANLLLHDGTTLIDKVFVMGEAGRAHNLYFVSWFDNVAWCLDNGLQVFQAGQAAYANKLRLGCRLLRTDMAFTHRNAVVSQVLKVLSPMFAADPVMEVA
ncbi:GNAT family N-acetyltransferase [Asticcacaulis solisilvae]|uniref:GNAT family N-acetyltransferase n=1 Tax=Asticcacaulis solisilvae TaxID=1217274 RepID=UPI003FD8ECF1